MKLSKEELNKTWLVVGSCGQDSSFFFEILLEKGYKNIHGIMRRSATFNTQNIDHIFDKLHLHHGDLTDSMNIHNIIAKVRPDYIVNFAAMSHVKVSEEISNYTFQTNTLGVLNILQSVKNLGMEKTCKIYQASTSEIFGNITDGSFKLNEDSPQNPCSVYAISKYAAQQLCNMYRDAYGMFVVNSLLFNHETISGNMPMIFKNNGDIDIKPISEIVKYHTRKSKLPSIDESKNVYQETEIETDLEIWDSNKWTKVTYASGYPHDITNNPKYPKYIISKNAAYLATDTHPIIMEDNSEKEVKDIQLGDKVKLTKYPEQIYNKEKLSIEEATIYGLICGDGYVRPNNKAFRIINSNVTVQEKCKSFWEIICKKHNYEYKYYYYPSKSGFNSDKIIGYIDFTSYDWINREQFYDEYKCKRVPKIILNSSVEIQKAFIEGYNLADGLKSKVDKTVYYFKRFKTNSPTLASGLLYLMSRVSPKQNYNINIDVKTETINGIDKCSYYYALTFNSDTKHSQNNSIEKYNKVKQLLKKGYTQTDIQNKEGISCYFTRKVQNGYIPDGSHHLQKKDNEVKKIIECYNYNGWFYDLETESGTFHCGIGQGVVHNSPRRGGTFVTKKITNYVGKYYKTKANTKGQLEKIGPLELGNLNAMRDWSHAKDMCYGIYLMLQQEKPKNYVLSNDTTHSVREFVELAFKEIGVEIVWRGTGVDEVGIKRGTEDDPEPHVIIKVNPKYYRDIDIQCLIGDSSRARNELKWSPKYSFEDLVKEMVQSSLI
jgi:GDPmannose 4,6-dehydratase